MAEAAKDSEANRQNDGESSLPELEPAPLPEHGNLENGQDIEENSKLDVHDCSSASFSEDTEWIPELSQALEEQCGLYEVCRITKGRLFPGDLRIRAWQACLDISWNLDEIPSGFAAWDGMFNLKSQSLLHEQCQNLVGNLGLEGDAEKLVLRSDIESVITAFCSEKNCDYDPNNGWIDVMRTLVRLKLPATFLYELFSAIMNKFIPKNGPKNEVIHHLFRLVVSYHDPELCNFIDSKKVQFEKFSSTWFSSLLSANCSHETVLAIWDIYFQNNDPFLALLLGLVLLLCARDDILALRDESKDQLTKFLKEIPSKMTTDDVIDFFQMAIANLAVTPRSLRETNWTSLFGTRPVSPTKRLHIPIPQALCLPVTIDEIVTAANRNNGCRFFVIDCRPPEQYNGGHLVTAFHLDAQLLIQDATAFAAAVEGLLVSQKQALEANSVAGGEHLCFMGSGFEAEDQFMHMVVARMLQKHHKFISMADGGYEALLYYIEVNTLEIDRVMVGTDIQKLAKKQLRKKSAAAAAAASVEDDSFFGKLKSAVKTQLPIMKDKITTYITNQPASTSALPVHHVSANDRPRKAHYRPMQSVFVFDEDEPDQYDSKTDFPEGDLQSWKEFIRRPDVLAHFECSEFLTAEHSVPAILVISETDIYNFRPSAEHPEMASLVSRHDLMEVLKIVCRRKVPELITIKFGGMENGTVSVRDIERYFIAKSGDAIKAIKMQILKLMAENEGRQWEE